MSSFIWEEALPEILESALNEEDDTFDWAEVSKALDEHVEATLEHQSYGRPSYGEIAAERESVEVRQLKARIEELEGDLRIYHDDIQRVKGGVYNTVDRERKRVVIYDR